MVRGWVVGGYDQWLCTHCRKVGHSDSVFNSRGSSNRPAGEWMTHKSLYKMKTAVRICKQTCRLFHQQCLSPQYSKAQLLDRIRITNLVPKLLPSFCK